MNKTASIVFIRPSYHGNPKLGAQKGLFTLWEFVNRYGRQISSDPTLFFLKKNSQKDKTLLNKLKLPSRYAPDLYGFLHKLGYHAARIFPGYQGASPKNSENLLCENVFQKLYKTQLE